MVKLKEVPIAINSGPNVLSKRDAAWHKGMPGKKEQFLITVAGLESKSGATHLCLSLALKASQRGINCAVILSQKCFDALRYYYVLNIYEEAENGQSEARQFANFAGLSIMSGVLPGDIEGYQLIVWDCGTLPRGQRRFARGDLRCIVSGGQAWELTPLNDLLMSLDYEELKYCAACIRGASLSDYIHIEQEMAGRLPCINILHKADWTDVAMREDLLAILRLAGF